MIVNFLVTVNDQVSCIGGRPRELCKTSSFTADYHLRHSTLSTIDCIFESADSQPASARIMPATKNESTGAVSNPKTVFKLCLLCSLPAEKRCAGCSINFCSVEHQREVGYDWHYYCPVRRCTKR